MWILLPAAWAADCPTPLAEDGLRAIVAGAKSAIDEGDTVAYEQASDELERRIPCLSGQLPSRPWADYLVTAALVKHLADAPDWNQPLSVALDLVPDHPDVPPFVMRDYLRPEPPTGPATTVPKDLVVMLDGKVVLGELPPLAGTHVVQKVVDGRWTSLLLRDEPLPAGFIPVEVEQPEVPSAGGFTWGTVGVSGGWGGWRQVAYDDLIADREAGGATLGLTSVGQIAFGDADVGLMWNGDLAVQLAEDPNGNAQPAPFGSGFVGVSFLAPVSIFGGVGLSTVRVQEVKANGDNERPLLVPHYIVGASYHSTGDIPVDATLGGGFGPATSARDNDDPKGGWGSHLLGSAGVAPIDLGSVKLRFGADFRWARATLGDQGQSLSERTPLATANTWRAGATIGIRWGG